MNGERFRKLIGPGPHGFGELVLRGMLGTAELPYHFVTSFRNFLYDNGFKKIHRLPIPVVSVGNLTLGGTGKTPMVAWLAKEFLQCGLQPGLISRGYGKASETVNDEFKELAMRFPNVPHLQNKDRVAAAEEFLARHGENSVEDPTEKTVDVLILDDAFQHRRIGRNLDIVLLDATEPFGFEHIFPRGTLRESIFGLRRADAVLLSRADMVSEEQRNKIHQRVTKIAPQASWGEVVHAPESLISILGERKGEKRELAELSGKRVLAFCGIGNPDAFRRTLQNCQIDVAELIPFPDHHRFAQADLQQIKDRSRRLGVDAILCTMKDAVKINESRLDDKPIWALSIDIRFLVGEDALRDRLRIALNGAAAPV